MALNLDCRLEYVQNERILPLHKYTYTFRFRPQFVNESSILKKSNSVFTHELKFNTPLWTWACEYTVFTLRSVISIITEMFSKHLSKKCCFYATFHFSVKDIVEYYGGSINPFRTN